MGVSASVLRRLAALGLSSEQLSAVLEVMAEAVEADEIRREKQAERKRRQRDGSVTVTGQSKDSHMDTPHPPFSDKERSPTPPKEINSSPLTPQTTLPGEGAKIDFDSLSQKLEEAGNGKIQPHSLLVIGPIVELMASGANLDLDILPTVRSVSARLGKTVSLSYFIGPIREAYERRVNAGRDLTPPKPFDDSEFAWARRLKFGRNRREWSTVEWGPAPGKPGCRVPAHLLIEDDGKGWAEFQNRSAA